MLKSRTSKILVVIRGHVGDLVQSFPALRDLRGGFADAHITVFLNEYLRGALDGCPYVDEVLYGFHYNPKSTVERVTSYLGIIRDITNRYDIALSLCHGPAEFPLMARLSGAKKRIAFGRGRLQFLLTDNLGSEGKGISKRVLNLSLLSHLGLVASPKFSPLTWLAQPIRDSVERTLRQSGIEPGSPFAVLQISCNWGCNEWDTGKWAALIEKLGVTHGLQFVVPGTDDVFEKRKFEAVKEATAGKVVSLHGQTSLPELFALVGMASLVIATDSALTQVALAQETPAVVMWGIEPAGPNGPLEEELPLFEVVQHWPGPEAAPRVNSLCTLEGYGPPRAHCHSANCVENSSLRKTAVAEVEECVRVVLARAESLR